MEELQTLGICISSVALTAIAVMMFFILVALGSSQEEDEVYMSFADAIDAHFDKPARRGRPPKKS